MLKCGEREQELSGIERWRKRRMREGEERREEKRRKKRELLERDEE